MAVRFTHSIGALAADLQSIAVTAKPRMAAIVSKGVTEGTQVAQSLARSRSGLHGRRYYKRISGEMTGLLEGEFGPSGDVRGNAVGAGWRHGVNNDLPNAADVMGPKVAADDRALFDDLYWPGRG